MKPGLQKRLKKRIDCGGNHLGCRTSRTEKGLQCGLSGNRVARKATPRRSAERGTAPIGNEGCAVGKANPYLSRKIYFFWVRLGFSSITTYTENACPANGVPICVASCVGSDYKGRKGAQILFYSEYHHIIGTAFFVSLWLGNGLAEYGESVPKANGVT